MKKMIAYCVTVLVVCASVLLICLLASRTVSVMTLQEIRNRQHRIVIDPGHGGIDGGATSCTGKLESGYNLEIALRLRDLCHLLGYPTRMIRTIDTSIYTKGDTIAAQKMSDLKQRVSIVNEQENHLLISIHQNNFADSRYSGAQVFYGGSAGSRELAESLQSSLVESLNPGSRRRAKKAEGIYIMEHIRNTGVLVECGFLSNPEEESRLADGAYQKKLCCVIVCSLANFLTEAYANT